MPNIFDSIKKTTHGVITKTFGYDAVWVSSVSGISYTARIGYRDPSEKEYLAGLDDFEPKEPYMDYFITDFPGLKESVDASNAEYVTIEGKGYFWIKSITAKSDGDTHLAKMQISVP